MTRHQLVPLSLALLVTSAACGGDDPAAPTGPPGQGSISARIDGVPWSSAIPLANRAAASGHIIAVGGASAGGTIAFAFQWAEGTSTYTIPTAGLNASLTVGQNVWRAPADGTVASPDGTGGTITITTINDERIAGTFSFTLKSVTGSPQMRQVTEGQFNIRF